MKFLQLVLLSLAARAFGFGDQGQVFIPVDQQPFTFAQEFFEEAGGYRGFWSSTAEGLVQSRVTDVGVPDRSFASNGILGSRNSTPWAIFPVGNGVYRTLHNINGRTYLSRIKANGMVDTRFGHRGYQLISSTSSVRCAMIDPAGKILMVAERMIGSRRSFVMERYLNDGRMDRTFGQRLGYLFISNIPQDSPSRCEGIVMKKDQSIVASLHVFGPTKQTLIVNALPNGRGLNRNFARNGILDSYTIVPTGSPSDLKLGANDTILSYVASRLPVNGGLGYDSYLIAIDARGQLDRRFANEGLIRIEDVFTSKFAVDENHAIVITHEDKATGTMKVRKFLSNGQPDMNFGTDGVSSTGIKPGGFIASPEGVILDREGRIVVYGKSVMRGLVFDRLLPDGTPDRGDVETPASL